MYDYLSDIIIISIFMTWAFFLQDCLHVQLYTVGSLRLSSSLNTKWSNTFFPLRFALSTEVAICFAFRKKNKILAIDSFGCDFFILLLPNEQCEKCTPWTMNSAAKWQIHWKFFLHFFHLFFSRFKFMGGQILNCWSMRQRRRWTKNSKHFSRVNEWPTKRWFIWTKLYSDIESDRHDDTSLIRLYHFNHATWQQSPMTIVD